MTASRQAVAHAAGLAAGIVNRFRHELIGYTTPRPFDSADLARNVDYAIGVARRWQQFVPIKGRRILEIGPGPDLGTGAVLLADGAESYHAVDLFPLATRDLSDFYAVLGQRLGSTVQPAQLGYTLASFPALPELAVEFDLVLSHATLEHVDDVPSLFYRLRALSPGCDMCHHIDAMTHIGMIRQRDPLNILRFGASTYRAMSFPGVPNRLRAGDYVQAAEAAGFDHVRVISHREASPAHVETIRPGLDPAFRTRPDLHLLAFELVCGSQAVDVSHSQAHEGR